ncbi:PAS domain S-box protein [Meiothermus granaticius]|uniref:histidine kinase n=1 Tax=Meiothermus granaticius NBRC 107808 TaxID=1227551 RepID=A0A399FEK4_9DEIN|nr:PAS domain S-box protein [Meiothermus granaticius]RIH93552.1 Non-motile and phage-resistance protein [Meiothermus granaticius NBRC 107808]GEM86049.1 hypothetical protein MGR01S_06740 [Meiothermus granaticius NBRC 107808]
MHPPLSARKLLTTPVPDGLVVIGTLVLLGLGVAWLVFLQGNRDDHAQSALLLSRLEATLNLQRSWEVQGLERGQIRQEQLRLIQRYRHQSETLFAQLRHGQPGSTRTAWFEQLWQANRVYQSALQQGLELLQTGRADAARAMSRQSIDPSYQRLSQALAQAVQQTQQAAALARRGIFFDFGLGLGLTVLALGWLFWRLGQTQAAAAAERLHYQAVQENEQFLQRVAEATPDILYVYDLTQQRNRYINRGVAGLGYSPAEIGQIGSRESPSLIHPDDLPGFRAAQGQLQVLGDGEVLEVEYRLKAKDGSYRWLHDRSLVLARDRGHPTQLLGIAQDITRQKQAQERLTRQSQQRQRLLKGAEQLVSSLSLQEVLGRLPVVLGGMVPFEALGVYDLDRKRGLLRPQLLSGEWITPEAGSQFIPLDQGIVGAVAQSGQAERVNQIHLQAHLDPYPASSQASRHLLALPLNAQGQVFGVVVVGRSDPPFDLEEFEQVQLLVNYLALGLNNAQLHSSTARQAQELSLLSRIQQAIGQDLELPVLIRTVVGAVAEVFGYTQVSLYLREGQELVLQHQVGYSRVIERIPVGQGVSGRAVQNGKAVLLEDTQSDPTFLGAIEGIVSEVCVPLFDGGSAVGVINVETTDGMRLSPEDLRLMEQVAQQISLALKQARLYQVVKEGEERFRGAFYETSTGMALVTLDGRWLAVNDALCGMLGYSREELLSKTFQEITHPDDLENDLRQTARLVAGEIGSLHFEKRYLHKEGQQVWVMLDVALLRSAGKATGFITHIQDISQPKRREQQLRESEERFRSAFDLASIGMALLTVEGHYLRVNPVLCAMLGYQQEELLGADFQHLTHPDDLGQDLELGYQVLRGEIESFSREKRYLHKKGQVVWVLLNVALIRDSTGNPLYYINQVVDISQRRQVEEALQKSEALYRGMVEALEEGIVLQDAGGHIVEANDAAERVLGLTRDQMMGRTSMDPRWRAVHEDGSDFPGDTHPAMLTLRTGEPQRNVIMGIHKPDRSLSWLLVNTQALVAAGGDQPYAVVTSFLDISEQKRAEMELRALQERLSSLLTSSPVVIYSAQLGDRWPLEVSFVSENVQRITGFAAERFSEPDFWEERLHPEDREATLADLQPLLQQGSQVQEYRWQHADGSYHWMRDEQRLLRDQTGSPLEVVGTWADVSQQKTLQEIRAAQQAAEQANRAKSEFLSRMSHELRTPMNAILGFGQLLQMENPTPAQRESIEQILKAGRHLLQLINEVLDISRIEAGRMTLSLEPLHLDEVVQECLNLVRLVAGSRNIQLNFPAPESCHPIIQADRQRLKQVLLNLLSNAIKYNHDGGMVSLFCRETAEGTLMVGVQDTGPGIAPELLERLFTPFDRLGAEQGREEGTGLGLALSKALIEAMQGRLWAESTLGQGSTFWVELPLASPMPTLEPARPAIEPPQGVPDGARNLLYIEDNLANLRLVERVLARWPNVQLLSAMQGRLGLELALSQPPDLILLDLHLPDLPGQEVLARLKAHPQTRAIPVIVLSADASDHQIERLLTQGATAYLTKPLDLEAFYRVLRKALGGSSEQTLNPPA